MGTRSVRLQKVIREPEVHQVTFPLYRKHEIDDGSCYYTKIVETPKPGEPDALTAFTVYESGILPGKQITIESYRFSQQSSAEYNLGLGEYACTPAEFDEAVKRLKEAVQRVEGRAALIDEVMRHAVQHLEVLEAGRARQRAWTREQQLEWQQKYNARQPCEPLVRDDDIDAAVTAVVKAARHWATGRPVPTA